MQLFDLAKKLSALPAVSGRECLAHDELIKQCGDLFDEYQRTPTGSVIAIKRSNKKNAKKVMVDAHLDGVGFYVKNIHENGFLGVINVGKVDTGILSAAEVEIYGTETITGVFTSKPPHLQEKDEAQKKPKLADLYIDTGISTERLKEIAPIGTPVAFKSEVEVLNGSRICGKYFDDRICILAIMHAVEMIGGEDIGCDIYAVFTGGEEIGYIGASTSAFAIEPDLAIALDVCNAYTEGADEIYKARRLGGGTTFTFSATTCRDLTESLIQTAKENGLPYQVTADANRTGSNAHIHQMVKAGIPGALISVPLTYMHTSNEIIDLNDVETTAKLLMAFLKKIGESN